MPVPGSDTRAPPPRVLLPTSCGTIDTGGVVLQLTITTAIQARWGHRVDGLIHTHAWSVEATVVGPAQALAASATRTVSPSSVCFGSIGWIRILPCSSVRGQT